MDTAIVISRLIPVILLIGLGWILKQLRVITTEGTVFIKKIIVNVALPAVMFLSFLNMRMTTSLILFIPGMFLLNIFLLYTGKVFSSFTGGIFSRFLFAGFEYGMFAVAVFTAAYGTEAVSYIAIIDLGHEFFIWFIYVTLLTAASGKRENTNIIKSFFKSPIILAIAAGIIANLFNLGPFFSRNYISRGIITSIEMLRALTAPLILLSIGAGLSLSKPGIKLALKISALRVPIVLFLYLLIKILMSDILKLPFAFEAAFFTLIISPPPFIIPMFIPNENAVERGVVNTVLTVYTMISLVLFIIFFSFHPVL